MRRIVVLVLGAVFFISCGKRSEEGTTLRFWQFWDLAIIEPIVHEFERAHPGVRVEIEQLTWKSGLEKIQAAVASGTQPDLCELGSTWVPRFSYEGVLEDLTSIYEAAADSFLMWESTRWQGKCWGLPWVQGSRVLFYNRALFTRVGLDPDRPPETWYELIDAAERIHGLDEGIKGFGLNMGERYVLYKKFMAFAWGNGGRILGDDGTTVRFDSPENRRAMSYYLGLAKYSLKEKQEVLDYYFKSGKLGMQISGAWNLRNLAIEAPSLDYGVALVPKPSKDEGFHGSFAGAEILVVFAKSKQKPLALELARFLQAYPQAKQVSLAVGSVFPAAKEALEDPAFISDERMAVFIKQAFESRTPPAHPGWLEMEDVINKAVEEVIYGRATPESALEAANTEIEQIVKKYASR